MEDEININVIKLKNGNRTAFNVLYNNTYRIVYTLALRIMKDEYDAWDIVQNVYIKVINKIYTLENESKFISWIITLTYNECKNMLKAQKRSMANVDFNNDILDIEETLETGSNDYNPDELSINKESEKEIQNIINCLPTEQKETVLMYYFEGKSINEISNELNCASGTVKSRLNYARKHLKNTINEYETKHKVKLHSNIIPLILSDWMNKLNFTRNLVLLASTAAVSTTAICGISSVNNNLNSDYNNLNSSNKYAYNDNADSATSKNSISHKETEDNKAIVTTIDQKKYVADFSSSTSSDINVTVTEIATVNKSSDCIQTTVSDSTKQNVKYSESDDTNNKEIPNNISPDKNKDKLSDDNLIPLNRNNEFNNKDMNNDESIRANMKSNKNPDDEFIYPNLELNKNQDDHAYKDSDNNIKANSNPEHNAISSDQKSDEKEIYPNYDKKPDPLR